MKMSVVIATRNRAALLEGALASLRAQLGAPEIEAIVVDNGSSDDTRAVAERHGATYRFEAQPNRALARNVGIAAATGEIVLFVDDDVVLPPYFVAAHARTHGAGIFPLVVTGPIINVPSADVRPVPTFVNGSNAYFCTCNVSVPRSALDAVGRFDESFDKYGWEDTELGVRLRNFDVRSTPRSRRRSRRRAWRQSSCARIRRAAPSSRPARMPSTGCARTCSRRARRKRG